mgnify:CR=1 FL=1
MKRVKCLDCGFVEYRVIPTDVIVYCRRCIPGPIPMNPMPQKGICMWKDA